MLRIRQHIILGELQEIEEVEITVDGEVVRARPGEMIAAALMAAGIRALRWTKKHDHPRGVYCAIGRCTDCAMTVDGIPNVRTCITPVKAGMVIETQKGLGKWSVPAGGGDDESS